MEGSRQSNPAAPNARRLVNGLHPSTRAVTAAVEAFAEDELRYVSDLQPGFRRERHGTGVIYRRPNGQSICDQRVLKRIRSLAIPPAWRDVWICALPNGHLQATGRDARGRKQHRYHPLWREVRDRVKYTHMIDFAHALPRIRQRLRRDLATAPGLSRRRVLATLVRLLEISLVRVGNAEYARENNSFGLTTLRDHHVHISGPTLSFRFRGKSGKNHAITVRNRQLARIVSRCQDIPGQILFQYLDEDGRRHRIESTDVNAYLREISGGDFTAKDFRTWAGTVLAASELRQCPGCRSGRQARRHIVAAVTSVASRLGNTPAICRKSYIHPAILESYLDGTLHKFCARPADDRTSGRGQRLSVEEGDILKLLRHRLKCEQQRGDLREQLQASLRQERRTKAAK